MITKSINAFCDSDMVRDLLQEIVIRFGDKNS